MALSSQRAFVTPEPGEGWDALAARVLPGEADAVQRLRSWNLHLFARMPPGQFTGCDVIFVEPPRHAGGPVLPPLPGADEPGRG
jgi:hypothetical protein